MPLRLRLRRIGIKRTLGRLSLGSERMAAVVSDLGLDGRALLLAHGDPLPAWRAL
jgi:hypothetical protein